jgi:hypothetical protein
VSSLLIDSIDSLDPGSSLQVRSVVEIHATPDHFVLLRSLHIWPLSEGKNATLYRNFTSGTSVLFTYDATMKDGEGQIFWSGGE